MPSTFSISLILRNINFSYRNDPKFSDCELQSDQGSILFAILSASFGLIILW